MAVHKKRRKSPDEDLAAAVADMIQSPITRANLSFLTVPAEQEKQPTIVDNTIVKTATVIPYLVETPHETTTVDHSPEKTTLGQPAIAEPTIVVPQKLPKVHHCRTVQDGHSPSEQGLYMMLWGIGIPMGEDTRLVQVSLTKLAGRAGMTIKNLQLMLRRLEEKKTIALAKSFSYATKAPNAYHVFSYKAILQRRREAGLEYVVRNKGVQFIPTAEALRIQRVREEEENRLFEMPTIEGTTIVDMLNSTETTIVKPDQSTIVSDVETTIVDSAAQPIREQKSLEQTSSEQTTLVHILRSALGQADDAAAHRLLHQCRKRAPDATWQEIEYFLLQKLQLLKGMQNVRNPVGLLLTIVPSCFEGENFRQFRAEQTRRQEREATEKAAVEAERSRLQAVLNDPQASEQAKREARWCLGLSTESPW
jgi:hypothetical protein